MNSLGLASLVPDADRSQAFHRFAAEYLKRKKPSADATIWRKCSAYLSCEQAYRAANPGACWIAPIRIDCKSRTGVRRDTINIDHTTTKFVLCDKLLVLVHEKNIDYSKHQDFGLWHWSISHQNTCVLSKRKIWSDVFIMAHTVRVFNSWSTSTGFLLSRSTSPMLLKCLRNRTVSELKTSAYIQLDVHTPLCCECTCIHNIN